MAFTSPIPLIVAVAMLGGTVQRSTVESPLTTAARSAVNEAMASGGRLVGAFVM